MDNQYLNSLTSTISNTGQVSLPPKIPNASSASPPSQCISNQSDKQVQNLQSSSARILTEEPPPWLEELLNEPETPVTRGHRRSASHPFTYLEANSRNNADLWLMNTVEGPSWGFQKSGYFKDMVQASSSNKQPTSNVEQNTQRKSQSDCTSCYSDTASQVDDRTGRGPMLVSSSQNDQRAVPLAAEDVRSQGQSFSHDAESSSRGSEASQTEDAAPASASKVESKRLKQHNGQRSRLRKLQYIAELERNVQALQVKGSAVCAQLQFLDQRNLILVMENKALKQRLQSLSQVQIIKSMEQEILERELAGLQYVYYQQNLHLHLRHQQHPPQLQQRYPMHRRGRSCDLDSQFARLSMNPG